MSDVCFLEVCGLRKAYGDKTVLSGFDAEFPCGRCTAIMGPSGCGKTTLLRILAGLEAQDFGEIRIKGCLGSSEDGEPFSPVGSVASGGHRSPAGSAASGGHRSPVGSAASGGHRNPAGRVSMVFQEDRLMTGFSALENLKAVLGKNREAEIKQALTFLGLGESFRKPVRELSGGMKRRVAIARAVLAEHEVLLLDEPFRGLDQETKKTAAGFILEKSAGKTLIMTTHDQEEAALMQAEKVILMN